MFRPLVLAASVTLMGCSSMQSLMMAPLKWMGLAQEPLPEIDSDFSETALLAHVEQLASDAYAGRLPGTAGGEQSIAYIEAQFRQMGVAPGHPEGGYRQSVPLAGIRAAADAGVDVAGRAIPLQIQKDLVIESSRVQPLVRVRKSPMLFVGYGVQAPEHDWDDYKGLDVAGKTLLLLVNDPPGSDGQAFKGEAMTYYGRWTYKYDIASRLGAAAVLVIHETEAAGYPWEVPAQGANSEHFTLYSPNGNADRVPVQGWIRHQKVAELLSAAGLDYAALKRAAARRDFQPVRLPAVASFQLRQQTRQLESANVVGLVRGKRWPEQYQVVTAHWDHLGRDASLAGDQIFNGAVDNAAGVAGLLELARHFVAQPADRSMLFLAVTAEEQGLLGARHYAQNPLYPLDRTVANFNLDAPNVWGLTRDVSLTGYGQNTLEETLRQEASAQGREVVPEPEPQKGYYYRSDHFEFAKVGVPSLFFSPLGGMEFVGENADQARKARRSYTDVAYHKVNDEIMPAWDLAGFSADLQLIANTMRAVAAAEDWPRWQPDSEFARLRKPRHP